MTLVLFGGKLITSTFIFGVYYQPNVFRNLTKPLNQYYTYVRRVSINLAWLTCMGPLSFTP